MFEQIKEKLNKGERPNQAEMIYLRIVSTYPRAQAVLSVEHLGPRSPRRRSGRFLYEARRSGGKVLVTVAFETYHPEAEELFRRLTAAVRELLSSSTSAKALRLRNLEAA